MVTRVALKRPITPVACLTSPDASTNMLARGPLVPLPAPAPATGAPRAPDSCSKTRSRPATLTGGFYAVVEASGTAMPFWSSYQPDRAMFHDTATLGVSERYRASRSLAIEISPFHSRKL